MVILSINSCNYGSTGNIMLNVSELTKEEGIDSYVSFPDSKQNRRKDIVNSYNIGNRYNRYIAQLLSLFTGKDGGFGYFYTLRFINKIAKLHPNIIHLHNLHNGYINLPLLFKYIKKNNIRVIWTLHDCWAFTGHCPYFTLVKCDKWKTGCYKCPQYKEYPKSIFDNSKKMYCLKKEWFTGVENLTIVTPSDWLAGLVKESFLRDYPVKVINNGIDLNVFRPTESDFREKNNIAKDKFILLGVAFGWGKRKGLDVFIELSKRLDNEKYQIVLVGTDDNVDKQLPQNIISIHRTQNQKELAEIYTAADLFVNPTREENYPTVNMESIACGTPVLTFRTGGSPEILTDKTGYVVGCDDIDELEKEIIRIKEERPFNKEDCIEHSKSFDMNERFKEYIELYKNESI